MYDICCSNKLKYTHNALFPVCFRYNIELTDMQVLLGRPQDNWRHAYSRVSSRLHVIDRFSISLQLERWDFTHRLFNALPVVRQANGICYRFHIIKESLNIFGNGYISYEERDVALW